MSCSKEIVVGVPGSKSISNRVILAAALSEGQSVIKNVPANQDVWATIEAIRTLCVQCKVYDNTLEVIGSGGNFKQSKYELFCKDAGTLTRFIIPICAAQQTGEFFIHASKQMTERPIKDLLLILEKLGMQAEYTNKSYSLPMIVRANGLFSKEVKIDTLKSSQFLSGLLISSPNIKGDLIIRASSDCRRAYVQMTKGVMKDFGVKVEGSKDSYSVRDKITYKGCQYTIEPDVSTASYFWALAAITKSKVKVEGTQIKSSQSDIEFLNVLEQMGCKIIEERGGVVVIGSEELRGVNVNMQNCSDTFMTAAAVACFAKSSTHITGIARTKRQESDRIVAMAAGLRKIGVAITVCADSMHIFPSESQIKDAVVDSFDDHRIAMSLALIGLRGSKVVINNAECVSKTFPNYFEEMNKIVRSRVNINVRNFN